MPDAGPNEDDDHNPDATEDQNESDQADATNAAEDSNPTEDDTADDDTDNAESQAAANQNAQANNAAAGSASGAHTTAALAVGGAAVAGAAVAGVGMFASMVTATLTPIDPPMPPISFQFNPDEFSETAGGKWDHTSQPDSDGTIPVWLGMEQQKLEINMLLDQFSVPPPIMPPLMVVDYLKTLIEPTTESLMDDNPVAPIVRFSWGTFCPMEMGTIQAMTVKYQRFMLGTPIRILVNLKMVGVPDGVPGPTNPSSGGLAPLRTHTVIDGDSLASIAFKSYKNPNRWRALAIANNIDDPMRLKVGQVIQVPDRRTAEILADG